MLDLLLEQVVLVQEQDLITIGQETLVLCEDVEDARLMFA